MAYEYSGPDGQKHQTENWSEMITALKAFPGCPDLSEVRHGDANYLGRHVLQGTGLSARWLPPSPEPENHWQKVSMKMAHMPDAVGHWEPRGFRVMRTRTEPFVDEVGDPYLIDIWHGVEGPEVGAVRADYCLHTGDSLLVGLPTDPFLVEARKRWAEEIRVSDEEHGDWWQARFGHRFDGRIHPGDRRVKVP